MSATEPNGLILGSDAQRVNDNQTGEGMQQYQYGVLVRALENDVPATAARSARLRERWVNAKNGRLEAGSTKLIAA